MSLETLTPSQAGEAISQAFAQIAKKYPDHFDTWPRMLGQDADRIADVLDPMKKDEFYGYVAVHYTNTNMPEPILWSPMQTEIRDAVAAVLNPVPEDEPSVDKSTRGIVATRTKYKTAVPDIIITALEVQNSYKNEAKTYWSVMKASAFNE